jgi:hypothetical protein
MMTRNAAMELIVELVRRTQGCKSSMLAPLMIRGLKEKYTAFAEHDLIDMVGELVAMRLITEIEYVLPDEPECTKSWLLPIGTRVLEDVDGNETRAWNEMSRRALQKWAEEN